MRPVTKVKISELTTLKNGLFEIYYNYWWIVTADDEILFARNNKGYLGSPQCNLDESISKQIQEKLYPDCTIRQIPAVYVAANPYDYC